MLDPLSSAMLHGNTVTIPSGISITLGTPIPTNRLQLQKTQSSLSTSNASSPFSSNHPSAFQSVNPITTQQGYFDTNQPEASKQHASFSSIDNLNRENGHLFYATPTNHHNGEASRNLAVFRTYIQDSSTQDPSSLHSPAVDHSLQRSSPDSPSTVLSTKPENCPDITSTSPSICDRSSSFTHYRRKQRRYR